MADETEIKEAVETIAEAAGDAVSAEEQIEAANERAEAAEELAEDIAEAALESERGRRIDALQTEFASWRETLAGNLSKQETALAELSSRLTMELAAMEAKIPATMTVETRPAAEALTLPASEAVAETVTTVTVDGANAPTKESQEAPVPAKRKANWL
jgi:hypothetical protein